jgi:hypothetical protein
MARGWGYGLEELPGGVELDAFASE